MLYSRDEHIRFLEEELRAQTEAFKQKLDTSALFLLQEREELYVAQFLKFQEGEMILKFSNNRGLPRQGEYLYCFTIFKELRNYRNWGKRTYGDLIKSKDNFSEVVCIWQAPTEDSSFSIAGFRGIDLEFAEYIQNAEGMVLILGPNKPPFEYISNLQKVVSNYTNEVVSQIIDQDFQSADWVPVLLDNRKDVGKFILSQLALQPIIAIQGPPGTGKTFLIAEICRQLCNQGKSVLVTALTNRALIEIVEKPAMKELLQEHRIFKTSLSVDEARAHKDLQQLKDVNPMPGKLILSTFYITSGQASQAINDAPFDFVIVDEASQALLAMFAAANVLGSKNIWIGDTNQIPPVVAINEDKVSKRNYATLVDGFKALTDNASIPIFQLTETHRLTERAAKYTGLFYENRLKSKAKNDIRLYFPEMPGGAARYFHPKGGPSLIKTDLHIIDNKPLNGLLITAELVKQLLGVNEKLHISVLSYFVETTKALQREIFQSTGYHKNLIVETVSRVQGLTTDICIFLIPNGSYYRSLEKRVFNVATSRSKRHTIIIADKGLLSSSYLDKEVMKFLKELDNDFSFFVNPVSKPIMLKE